MSAACTGFMACLYGLDAEKISLRRDERHNALYVELGDDVHIRLSLERADREDDLERDRVALRQLADVAGQAARELGQLLGLAGGEDQAAEDTRRLAEIRGLLAAFDWEHDDRQYALEQIEMIAEGGQP